MAVTAVELLRHSTLPGLVAMIATSAAAGKQPLGVPYHVDTDGSPYWAQAMTTGVVENTNISTNLLPTRSDTITVTSAQLLALNATPKSLIAAPGAGKANIPVFAELFLDYNSAAYAGIAAGEDLNFCYTNGSGAIIGTVEATGFLDQTSDQHRFIQFYGTVTPVANAAIVLHMASGEVITGNSPLYARVHYRTVDLMS